MSLIALYFMLTVLGECGAMIYLAYAIPAYLRANPLYPRRTASFIAATLAIAPTVVFVGMLLLGMADLLLTNLGFHMSITMHVWLSSLLGTMSVSLLCGAALQEFFKDRELLMVSVRAGGVASGIITVLGVPFLLLGDEFASGLVLVGLLALLVWHMFVGVRLMSRARVVRARTLGEARRCVKCLYDIRDVVGGRCPECGAVIATPPTTTAPSDFKSEI